MPSAPSSMAYTWPVLDGATEASYTLYLQQWLGLPTPASEDCGAESRNSPTPLPSVVSLNTCLIGKGVSASSTAAAADEDASGTTPARAPLLVLSPPTSTHAPHGKEWLRAHAEALQWLCAGVTNEPSSCTPLGTLTIAQSALDSVTRTTDEPCAAQSDDFLLENDGLRLASLVQRAAEASSATTDAASSDDSLRVGLVLLLFHRQRAVGLWARERLLDCVHAASATTMPGVGPMDSPRSLDGSASSETCPDRELADRRLCALWTFACQLVCVVKHLVQAKLPVHEKLLPCPLGSGYEGTRAGTAPPPASHQVVGNGIYNLLTVLTVLNEKLKGASGKERVVHTFPEIPLLLAGTMLLEWLQSTISATPEAPHVGAADANDAAGMRATARGPPAALAWQKRLAAAESLLWALNHQLSRDLTLQPPSLAAEVKRSLAKVLVHAMLSCARGCGNSATARPSSRRNWFGLAVNDASTPDGRSLRYLWAIAAAVKPPPPLSREVGRDSTAADPCANCAEWLLSPLLLNAASQLRLPIALAQAREPPRSAAVPPVARAISGAQGSDSPPSALEAAVVGYAVLLSSLLDALPWMRSSPRLHELLVEHEQALVSIAVGASLHCETPEAPQLLWLLMRVSVCTFSAESAMVPHEKASPQFVTLMAASTAARRGPPKECISRVWAVLPQLLRHALKYCSPAPQPARHAGKSPLDQDGAASSPPPASQRATPSHPPIAVLLFETLQVLIEEPRVARWLLMLPDLSQGPHPLAGKVRDCIYDMLETTRVHVDDIRACWERSVSTGPQAPELALAQLVTAGSAIPRTVHALLYAQWPPLRQLAQVMETVFLHSTRPLARQIMEADAAEWVWTRVIVQHPLLLGDGNNTSARESEVGPGKSVNAPRTVGVGAYWMELHDSKVDNFARLWGHAWLPVMCRCTWSSVTIADSPVYAATAWWMAALIAGVVCVEERDCRSEFLGMVARLPPMALTFSPCPAEPLREEPESSQEATRYAVLRQLLLSLLAKYELYDASHLVAAVLHVAGELPASQAQADTELLTEVKKTLERMHAFLSTPADLAVLSEHHGAQTDQCTLMETLRQSGPQWLVQALEQAAVSVDASLADQEERFRQFEWDEQQLARKAEGDTLREMESALRRRANEATRAKELERVVKRSADGGPVTASSVTGATSVSSSREAAESTAAASSPTTAVPWWSSTTSRERVLTQNLTLSVSRLGAGVATEAADSSSGNLHPLPKPTASQNRLQQQRDSALRDAANALTKDELQGRLCVIAASTDVFRPYVRVGDIIGFHPSCLAREVPVLPEIFLTSEEAEECSSGVTQTSMTERRAVTPEAATLYARRFVPHIALEMRHGIFRDFSEMAEAARTAGFVRSSDHAGMFWRGRGSAAPSWRGRGRGNYNAFSNEATTDEESLPLSRWVTAEATRVRFADRVVPSHADPNCIQIAVSRASVPVSHALPLPALSLAAVFNVNDVVCVLLPLATILPAWRKHAREVQNLSGNSTGARSVDAAPQTVKEFVSRVPERWRLLGCFPQVCVVAPFHKGSAHMNLKTYTSPWTQSNSTGPARDGALPRPRHGEARPPITFLHALNLGFNSKRGAQWPSSRSSHHVASSAERVGPILYVKRLGSLNPMQASVRALFGIRDTPFAGVLCDPRSSARISQCYYEALTRHLQNDPDTMKRVRARLLLQRVCNEWQVRAVAAVLYAVTPAWDRQPVLAGSVETVETVPSEDRTTALGDIPLGYVNDSSDGGPRSPTNSLSFSSIPRPEVLIIEGPPGTGKTQTLAVLILNVLHHLPVNSKVLMCAPSNCAVDEALMRVQRLQACLPSDLVNYSGSPSSAKSALLRVGVRDSVDKELLRRDPNVFLDNRLGEDAGNSSARVAEITSSPIVFTTLGSLAQISRCQLKYAVVIVDEASQATEPDVLQAMALASSRCVFVGDSKQLQPTVLCREAANAGLRRSLLVRLLRNGHSSFLLRTQFRMHPDICDFPNRYFYGSQLLTDVSVVRRQAVRTTAQLRSSSSDSSRAAAAAITGPLSIAQKLGHLPRLLFMDVPEGSAMYGRGNSLHNHLEAAAVVSVMRQMRAHLRLSESEFGTHCGIITFYTAQRATITALLSPAERKSDLHIATVDSFQGKEKDVILISCVRRATAAQLQKLYEGRASKRAAATAASGVIDVDATSALPEKTRGDGAGNEEEGQEGPSGDGTRENAVVCDSSSSSSSSSVSEAGECTHVGSAGSAVPSEMVTETGGTPAPDELPSAVPQPDANDDDLDDAGAAPGVLGFLSDWHRINVALTRAKDFCVVVGHRETLLAAAWVASGSQLSPDATAADPLSAAHANDHVSSQVAVHPTTANSSKDAVLRELEETDDDPRVLGALVIHATQHASHAAADHDNEQRIRAAVGTYPRDAGVVAVLQRTNEPNSSAPPPPV